MPESFLETTPYEIPKPEKKKWDRMALFEKIRYSCSVFTEAFAPFVDKLEAKVLAQQLCPEVGVPQTLYVVSNGQSLTQSDLEPFQHAIFKATHGCGWNVNMTPATRASEINHCMRRWNGPYSRREKQYLYITPRFFFEERLECFSGAVTMTDFKIMCLYGKPVFILIKKNDVSYYIDPTWSYVVQAHISGTHRVLELPPLPFDPPAQLDTMLWMASRLSRLFECVRIDLYLTNKETIVFGEFTFSHAGGVQRLALPLGHQIGAEWTYTRPGSTIEDT